MSWEVTLFYWTGWFACTFILGVLGYLGTLTLWELYNKSESAMRANAGLVAAWIKYAYKYRFKDADPKDVARLRLDGYQITVKEVEDK